MLWGHWVRPLPGEAVSGDAVAVRELDDGVLFAIIDGLGHGAPAHAAAAAACSYITGHGRADVRATLEGLHPVLTATCGAAVGLCFINRLSGAVSYAGIGNTVFRRLGPQSRHLISVDGTVGLFMHTPLVQCLTLAPGDIALLHTDGVPRRFDPQVAKALNATQPSVLARSIVQSFGKPSDDAGCLVIRYQAGFSGRWQG
jgi:hypothetical protein